MPSARLTAASSSLGCCPQDMPLVCVSFVSASLQQQQAGGLTVQQQL